MFHCHACDALRAKCEAYAWQADDDDNDASTIFGRGLGCYALLVKSALAGNMGFAVALGKAILVYMYVLRVLYSSGVH